MRPVAPRLVGHDEVMIAEEQHEFMPIAATLIDGGKTRICRWTFTREERDAVARGDDVFVGTPADVRLTPHYLHVGPPVGTEIESHGS